MENAVKTVKAMDRARKSVVVFLLSLTLLFGAPKRGFGGSTSWIDDFVRAAKAMAKGASKHADDIAKGGRAIRVARNAAKNEKVIVEILEESAKVGVKNTDEVLDICRRFGPEAARVALRNGDEAVTLIKIDGNTVMELVARYGPKEGTAIAQRMGPKGLKFCRTYGMEFAEQYRSWGDKAIDVIRKQGRKGLEFLKKHKGKALLAAGGTAVVLAPEKAKKPVREGAKRTITFVVKTVVGGLKKMIMGVSPLAFAGFVLVLMFVLSPVVKKVSWVFGPCLRLVKRRWGWAVALRRCKGGKRAGRRACAPAGAERSAIEPVVSEYGEVKQ